MTLEHATHTTYKITRFDSEEWLNYNKKERSKPLKNEPNCLKPGVHQKSPGEVGKASLGNPLKSRGTFEITCEEMVKIVKIAEVKS